MIVEFLIAYDNNTWDTREYDLTHDFRELCNEDLEEWWLNTHGCAPENENVAAVSVYNKRESNEPYGCKYVIGHGDNTWEYGTRSDIPADIAGDNEEVEEWIQERLQEEIGGLPSDWPVFIYALVILPPSEWKDMYET